MSILLLAVAILAEVAATLCLRASNGLHDKRFYAPVIGGYVLAFVMLSMTLSHGMAIGVAYGIWASSGVALTAIFARFFFHEPLTRVMAAGIALIIIGVLLVEVGASHAS